MFTDVRRHPLIFNPLRSAFDGVLALAPICISQHKSRDIEFPSFFSCSCSSLPVLVQQPSPVRPA